MELLGLPETKGHDDPTKTKVWRMRNRWCGRRMKIPT
jgi:hypothetical protein